MTYTKSDVIKSHMYPDSILLTLTRHKYKNNRKVYMNLNAVTQFNNNENT